MNRRSFMAGVLALLAPESRRPRGVGCVEIGRGRCFSLPAHLVTPYLKGYPVAGTRWEK